MGLGHITGHAPIRRLIARAVARDTLPPCLVLTGPDGVGKRRVALALAEMLNCEAVNPPEAGGPAAFPDACGVCGACQRIARGVHADVIIIEPGETGSIRVDAVRAAVDQAAFRPFEGRRRVVIIDDADRLVPEAQNALLKTLEEPPDHVVFVLATTEPHKVVETIRSRSQHLELNLLSGEELESLVRHVVDDAGLDVDDDGVAHAVRSGRGSARDTLSALAGRVGLPEAELARYNGLNAGATLRAGEVVALPRRVDAGSVDVTAVAGQALDRIGPNQPSNNSGTTSQQGAEPLRHQVVSGETAYSIARLYGVSVRSLAEWNGLGGDLSVRQGQYLMIPPKSAETAAPNTNSAPGVGTPTPLPPSSSNPLPEGSNRTASQGPADTPASPNLGAQRTSGAAMSMPADGRITGAYVKGKSDGIDIAAAYDVVVVQFVGEVDSNALAAAETALTAHSAGSRPLTALNKHGGTILVPCDAAGEVDDIVVRLSEALREDPNTLANLPIPLPRHTESGTQNSHLTPTRPLGDLATITRADGATED